MMSKQARSLNPLFKLLFVVYSSFFSGTDWVAKAPSKVVFRSFVVRWGPNRVSGKNEDYAFLSVKKVKTQFWAK